MKQAVNNSENSAYMEFESEESFFLPNWVE
jgi:hypothetical protein